MVVTFDATEEALARAIRLGARGYVLKNIDPPELRRALDAVRDTGWYHNELFEHHLRDHPGGYAQVELDREAIMRRLTTLELDYLKLLADWPEMPNKQMAGHLNGHEHTPDACQAALHHKFGITNKLSALVFALRWGVVKLPRDNGAT